MPQVVDGFGVRANEPAQAGQRLAERAHDQVDLVGQAEMTGRAGAMLAQDANGMGVVHHDGGAVFSGNAAQLGQGNNVALHAEHAVHDNELACFRLELMEAVLQGGHVFVRKAQELALRQQAALDNAGVVALVA